MLAYLAPLYLFTQQAFANGPDGWVHEIQGGGFALFLLWMIRQLWKERQERHRNPSHEQLTEAIKNMATKEGLSYVNREIGEVKKDLHGLRDDVVGLKTRVSVLEEKK